MSRKTDTAIDEIRCRFHDENPVEFAVGETGSKKQNGIRITANSGKPILGHWHWGNFALDLEGLQINRQDKPILLDHNPDEIVGYTSSIAIGPKGLVVEGVLLTGDDRAFEVGNRVKALADAGYPWQASVYVPPEEIEEVMEGESRTVNGYQLDGPGHVFRRATLREVTITSMGADEQTDAELFGKGRKGAAMTDRIPKKPEADDAHSAEVTPPKEATADVATLSSAPVGPSDVALAAVAEERKRIAKLTECSEGRQRSLLTKLINDGATLADGLEALLKDQQAHRAEMLAQMVSDAPKDLGFSEVDSGEEAEAVPQDGEDQFSADCRASFKKSKALQKEFLSFENYKGYCHLVGEVWTNEGNN